MTSAGHNVEPMYRTNKKNERQRDPVLSLALTSDGNSSRCLLGSSFRRPSERIVCERRVDSISLYLASSAEATAVIS